MDARHALTIELPETLYTKLARAAASRGKNLMTFAREALIEQAERLDEAELASAYELLANDAEECDVEPLFAAQAATLME
jgi:hypothetical protein